MALGFKVILISIGIIKMAECRHISKSSIIVAECMILRDSVLVVNLEIEGDLKMTVECYNKRINISSSIRLLIKDICKLS